MNIKTWLNRFELDLNLKYSNSLMTRNNYKSCVHNFLIQFQKQHFFHQISNKLIRENQSISCETLKIENLIKNKKLSKSIQDVSWSSFISILEYKSVWYNKELIKIPTFYPSSKLCSNCGNKKDDLQLSDRIYNCINCGISLNRDLNASYNIRDYRDKYTRI